MTIYDWLILTLAILFALLFIIRQIFQIIGGNKGECDSCQLKSVCFRSQKIKTGNKLTNNLK